MIITILNKSDPKQFVQKQMVKEVFPQVQVELSRYELQQEAKAHINKSHTG